MAFTSLAQCPGMPGIDHKNLKTAKSAQEPKTEIPLFVILVPCSGQISLRPL